MSIGLIALLDDIAAIAKVADSALHYLPTVTIVRSRNRYCTKTAPRWGGVYCGDSQGSASTTAFARRIVRHGPDSRAHASSNHLCNHCGAIFRCRAGRRYRLHRRDGSAGIRPRYHEADCPCAQHSRRNNWLCALRQGGLADVAKLLPICRPRRPIFSARRRCKSASVALPTRRGRLAAVGVRSDDTIGACRSVFGSKGTGGTTIHGIAVSWRRNRLCVWDNRCGRRYLSRASHSVVWLGRYAPNVRRLCSF